MVMQSVALLAEFLVRDIRTPPPGDEQWSLLSTHGNAKRSGILIPIFLGHLNFPANVPPSR